MRETEEKVKRVLSVLLPGKLSLTVPSPLHHLLPLMNNDDAEEPKIKFNPNKLPCVRVNSI